MSDNIIVIQTIKPACIICMYWNKSNMKKNDGWCSHNKLNGRHFTITCAKSGIQPDCPFKKGNIWMPNIPII